MHLNSLHSSCIGRFTLSQLREASISLTATAGKNCARAEGRLQFTWSGMTPQHRRHLLLAGAVLWTSQATERDAHSVPEFLRVKRPVPVVTAPVREGRRPAFSGCPSGTLPSSSEAFAREQVPKPAPASDFVYPRLLFSVERLTTGHRLANKKCRLIKASTRPRDPT
jgi:hypothetical protein